MALATMPVRRTQPGAPEETVYRRRPHLGETQIYQGKRVKERYRRVALSIPEARWWAPCVLAVP